MHSSCLLGDTVWQFLICPHMSFTHRVHHVSNFQRSHDSLISLPCRYESMPIHRQYYRNPLHTIHTHQVLRMYIMCMYAHLCIHICMYVYIYMKYVRIYVRMSCTYIQLLTYTRFTMYCSTCSLHFHLTCSTSPQSPPTHHHHHHSTYVHTYVRTYVCTYIHTSTYTLHVFGHLVLLLYGAVVLNGQDHWVVRHSKGMVLDGLNGIFEHDLAGEGVTMVDYRVVLITIPTVHCNTRNVN